MFIAYNIPCSHTAEDGLNNNISCGLCRLSKSTESRRIAVDNHACVKDIPVERYVCDAVVHFYLFAAVAKPHKVGNFLHCRIVIRSRMMVHVNFALAC